MSSFHNDWQRSQDEARARFALNQAQTNAFRAKLNQAPVGQQMQAQRDVTVAQRQVNSFLPNQK